MGNKYHAVKTEVHGIVFDSKKEARRYEDLYIMLCAGVIDNLQLQPKFLLIPKTDKYRARFYVADFAYRKDGQLIVEDVKGVQTQVYKLKKAMMYWKYGVEIKEV